MRAFLLRILLLAAAVSLPMRVSAQSSGHTLEPGDTVRMMTAAWGPRLIEGELLLYRSDSVAVLETATGTRYAAEYSGLQQLFKNEGLNRRRSIRKHATAGAFLGFATGVVLGPLISMERKDDDFVGATVVSSLGGGLLGLGIGTLTGAIFARDHWQPFRAPAHPANRPATAIGVSIPAP